VALRWLLGSWIRSVDIPMRAAAVFSLLGGILAGASPCFGAEVSGCTGLHGVQLMECELNVRRPQDRTRSQEPSSSAPTVPKPATPATVVHPSPAGPQIEIQRDVERSPLEPVPQAPKPVEATPDQAATPPPAPEAAHRPRTCTTFFPRSGSPITVCN